MYGVESFRHQRSSATVQTHLGHIQLNVRASNLPFYRDLFDFLGWPVLYADDQALGVAGQGDVSLWFMAEAKDVSNDYDGPGMNHLAVAVGAQSDVDAAVHYLTQHGIASLFETPRHRPEFAQSDTHTYYQVMFESPDHILLEVVYTGPKAG